jgi:hypothetical protein
MRYVKHNEEPMTEADLLNLAHTYNQDIPSAFGQIITITFAMVVGIYYFLNQAKLGLKIFAFIAYSIGMFMYLSLMLGSSYVVHGVYAALGALPADHTSLATGYALAIANSWLAPVESVFINVGFWALWLGVGYLLFVWKKADHMPPGAS